MSGVLLSYHHLSLSVSDLDRSVDWYQQVLGLEITAQVEGATFRRTRMRAPGGDVTLTLTCHDERSGDAFDERRAGLDHVSIRVDDLQAWKTRLEQHDVVHSDVKPLSGTASMVTLRDPDNIQLEIFSEQDSGSSETLTSPPHPTDREP